MIKFKFRLPLYLCAPHQFSDSDKERLLFVSRELYRSWIAAIEPSMTFEVTGDFTDKKDGTPEMVFHSSIAHRDVIRHIQRLLPKPANILKTSIIQCLV